MAARYGTFRNTSFLPVLCLLLLVAVPPPLFAADAVVVSVENTTGLPAADLHVVFSGAGGNLSVDPFSVYAPGCPTPSIFSNPPAITDTVVIDWGTDCVAPSETVVFIARTDNGPLTVVDGFWTNTVGGIIGTGISAGYPLPPAGPDLFSPFKFDSYYIGGNITYNSWQLNGDQELVECCRQPRWCFADVYFCPTADRYDELFEIGPWYYITTVHSYTPPRYTYFIRWLWGITRNFMPKGPPPSGSGIVGFGAYDKADRGLTARFSSDGGQTFREATDFTATFFSLTDSLAVHPASIGPSPPPQSTSEFLTQLGGRYAAASGTLAPLIAEVDSVRVYEPSVLLDDIHLSLENVQASMSAIAAQLLTGAATDPLPFEDLSAALAALGAGIEQVTPSLRFDNAAAELLDAAALVDSAAAIVSVGLTDIVTVSKFGYAMETRVPVALRSFGAMMWPHVVLQVNLDSYVWYPSTIGGAHVIIRDLADAVLVDLPLEINELGEIVVPTMNIPDGTPIKVWFKLPTCLSLQAQGIYEDGLRFGTYNVFLGDADGDDCIDLADVAVIGANLGAGGLGSPTAPPPSDVNGDGIVDFLDSSVAGENLGMCGPIVTAVGPQPTPRFTGLVAYPNPSSGTATIRFTLQQESRVSIRLYNVRGQQVAAVDRSFKAGENEAIVGGNNLTSGVYFCRLRAIGLSGVAYPVEGVTRLTVLK